MEGRDVGSVIFPNADVKIYLDAAAEERARRRAADPAHGSDRRTAIAEVKNEMEARDQSDRTRAISPLQIAPDAHVLDTTSMSVEEVVEKAMGIVRRKLESKI
jgi:cytidylate kinase